MTREDDVKKEMERIKASKYYQDYQRGHAEEIAAAKALVAKPAPHRLGATLDGKSEVWAPVAGPTAVLVEHLKTRRYWMCSWCRCTMRFKGQQFRRHVTRNDDGTVTIKDTKFNPEAIVDFDGKVYHSNCYYEMDRQRPKGLPEKESEDELLGTEGVRQGRERGLPGGVPQLPLHPGDLGCAGEEVRDPGEDGKGGG